MRSASLRAMRQLSDEQLVRQAQEGDTAAFAELIERHRAGCFKLALSILRNTADAEDEAQNAAWKAFEHIGQFQRDSKFSTWLMRILVNQCLMRLRRVKRSRPFYIDDQAAGEDAFPFDLQASDASPEQRLARAELQRVVDTEIRRIPPLLRHVMLLRDVQSLPMPAVARKLGISVAAAKSRLLRARVELRQRMGKHEGRLGPASLLFN